MAEPKDAENKLTQEEFARLGGNARARKLSADQRRSIAAKASKAAAKKRKAESEKKKAK